MKFTIRYQDAWTAKMKSPEWEELVRSDWLECLADLKPFHIKNGLRNLSTGEFDEFKKFPPNAMQFRDICFHDPDFPDVNTCYQAAIKGEWGIHPIVKPTANACDIYWLRRASENDAMKRFAGYYTQMKDKFLRGEKLDKNLEIEDKRMGVSSHWADKEIERRIKEQKNEIRT